MFNLEQMIDPVVTIKRKRDGIEHADQEIADLVDGFMTGDIPDYQVAAWLMAVFFRGLSFKETLALTDSLVGSGERLDLTSLGKAILDKHSTGGVGDKVTLVLGPVIAACGGVFGKMSGRGLGHTGGTIDKLESIPGFRTELSPGEFAGQLRETGVCIAAQSDDLVPADRKLYALRDVTATVESNPLIAASVMSKKIAGGAGAVVLDIKVGRGAFFKTIGHASGAAYLMRKIGESRGIEVIPVLTAMEQPLGYAVGNALEVREAVNTLSGNGPPDLVEVVTALAGRLLPYSGSGWDRERAEDEARGSLGDGAALAKSREWITAQGADPAFVDDLSPPAGVHEIPVMADSPGYIAGIDALRVGYAVRDLGSGRRFMGDKVNHEVGVVLTLKTGDRVSRGDELARIYAADESSGRAAANEVKEAFAISESVTAAGSVLIE